MHDAISSSLKSFFSDKHPKTPNICKLICLPLVGESLNSHLQHLRDLPTEWKCF